MRRFLPRILVCLIPTLLALVVVGWAYHRYEFVDGGGFRLGVDLVGGTERRSLTGDEVERIKSDIARQGRLEFRIIANQRDDRAAFAAATEYFKKANKEDLTRLEVKAEPPPPPKRDDGSDYFPVEL